MNKELAANAILSHYRIVSKLGAGGMGEVYLAQDTASRRYALSGSPAAHGNANGRMKESRKAYLQISQITPICGSVRERNL